ncbi:hypothetical protein Acr_21g0002320 [Actinidia rufa]|uniref:Uncharacterized protein n=1 Tax=Actinidia rufa TaxID=165716 RepID=A0A7J0GFN8_9ERIC|nr:hypothetical protein Acr_21g0002320 [Actinidia rufa]
MEIGVTFSNSLVFLISQRFRRGVAPISSLKSSISAYSIYSCYFSLGGFDEILEVKKRPEASLSFHSVVEVVVADTLDRSNVNQGAANLMVAMAAAEKAGKVSGVSVSVGVGVGVGVSTSEV